MSIFALKTMKIFTENYYFFHHTMCESTCDTLSSSAANQGDNTVSVAQGGTGSARSASTALSYRNCVINLVDG